MRIAGGAGAIAVRVASIMRVTMAVAVAVRVRNTYVRGVRIDQGVARRRWSAELGQHPIEQLIQANFGAQIGE